MKEIVEKEDSKITMNKIPDKGIIACVSSAGHFFILTKNNYPPISQMNWYLTSLSFAYPNINSAGSTKEETVSKNFNMDGTRLFYFEDLQDMAKAILDNGWK